MLFQGNELSLLSLKQRQKLFGREITTVFQDPAASFDPLRPFRGQFRDALKSQGLWEGGKTLAEVLVLFEKMGLPDPKRILRSRPWEMSGGMNQRIAIVPAIFLRPRLLLCDDPTSALDAIAQANLLKRLDSLRHEKGLALLFVCHDLPLARAFCHRTLEIPRKPSGST